MTKTEGIGLFEGISAEDTEKMLSCLGYMISDCRRGEIIAAEPQEMNNIGIILSGSVHMLKEDIWGGSTIIACMKRGELFGESFAWSSDRRLTVTFRAAENSQVMLICSDRMLSTCCRHCGYHDRLVANMVRLSADKNRQLLEKTDILSKKTIREKLLTYLSVRARERGILYFEVPLNRSELADYLCTDRSALGRELSNMKKDGLIDFDGNTFRLMKKIQ